MSNIDTRESVVGRRQPSTVPVRIDRELYDQLAAIAADEFRKVRQQIEMMLDQQIEARKAKIETRGGRR